MTEFANVKDAQSISLIYSFRDYSHDVSRNSRGKAAIYGGVLIAGPPGETGDFPIRKHDRAIAEEAPGTGGIFLSPFLGADYSSFYLVGGAKGAVLEQGDIFKGDDEENYRRFLESVVKTAAHAVWPKPMEPNRLKNSG